MTLGQQKVPEEKIAWEENGGEQSYPEMVTYLIRSIVAYGTLDTEP